jgi:putative membrane protein
MIYFIAPVTVFVLYVLTSIELIAEEIENPFNGDPNHLPTLEMALAIGGNAQWVLGSEDWGVRKIQACLVFVSGIL